MGTGQPRRPRPPTLVDEALTLARSVCAAAPLAVSAVKEILRATEAVSLDDGYRLLRGGGLPGYRAMLDSADAREGPRLRREAPAPMAGALTRCSPSGP